MALQYPHPSHPSLPIMAALFLLFVAGPADLQAQQLFLTEPDSRIWIEGRSNVNRFTCRASEYSGRAELAVDEAGYELTELDVPQASIVLRVVVESFDCGRARMNRDLAEALQSEQFPEIVFEYHRSTILDEKPGYARTILLEVDGELTVAGETRSIRFEAEGRYTPDGKVGAKGSTEILMTDYGVEPPTGLLGLVRAEDRLEVYFDLIASIPVSSPDMAGGEP
ncbi:MAG: YceI family protein [Balneolaceae bacterium]